ncbi:YwqG family protein [Breznakiellaceae bacterium SP9]
MNLPEELVKAGFVRQAEIFTSLKNSCIKIATDAAEEADFVLGESKIGGQPHLPPDFQWPLYNSKPLAFLAQFNLQDAAPFDAENKLPHSGILYFFYEGGEEVWGSDPKDKDGFKVVHFTGDLAALRPTPLPDGICEYAVLSPCKLHFAAEDVYPIGEVLDGIGLDPATAKELQTINRKDMKRYDEIMEAYEKTLFDGGSHRLLGYPDLIQGDIFTEAQLATNGLYCGDSSGYDDPRAKGLRAGVGDWTLLFQIDSDDNADVMWGDCGMVYFSIKKADLANGNFDRIWATFQCC